MLHSQRFVKNMGNFQNTCGKYFKHLLLFRYSFLMRNNGHCFMLSFNVTQCSYFVCFRQFDLEVREIMWAILSHTFRLSHKNLFFFIFQVLATSGFLLGTLLYFETKIPIGTAKFLKPCILNPHLRTSEKGWTLVKIKQRFTCTNSTSTLTN